MDAKVYSNGLPRTDLYSRLLSPVLNLKLSNLMTAENNQKDRFFALVKTLKRKKSTADMS